MTFAAYFGSTAEDEGYGVATDTGGNAFVAGASALAGIPMWLMYWQLRSRRAARHLRQRFCRSRPAATILR